MAKSIHIGLTVLGLLLLALVSYAAWVLPFMSQAPVRQWYLRNNMCMLEVAAQTCKKTNGHFPKSFEELKPFLPGGKAVNVKAGGTRIPPGMQPLNPYSYKDDWLKMEHYSKETEATRTLDMALTQGQIRYCIIQEPDSYILVARNGSGHALVWDSNSFQERADWFEKFNR